MQLNSIKPSFKVFIAVRMKSGRLPKKALLDIYGIPLIVRLFQRLEEVFNINDLVVCTSTNPQDDELHKTSTEYGINCYRGSELDVMGRFIEAATNMSAETVARVTGDNPLTDPKILKNMLFYHIKNKAEYTYTNDLPVGTRSEIIDINALKRIHKEISDPDSTEYMTYILKRPDKLKVSEYHVPNLDLRKPEFSLTVDNHSDLELIRRIYEAFNGNIPDLSEIIKWLEGQPREDIIILDKQENLDPIAGTDFSYKSDLF